MGARMFRKGLAVAVILLFIGMCIVPSTAVQELKEKSSPMCFDGNTLYVGGSGPNNYTRIQDAIDNSSDGDTVFVYVRTYPYFENLIIDKSIDLIGQDKNATLIDGEDNGNVIIIYADFVNISGFYIKGDTNGVDIRADFIGISDNIFEVQKISISIDYYLSNNNSIKYNYFFFEYLWDYGYKYVIKILNSNGNSIIGNTIYGYSENGFYIIGDNNTISDNKIIHSIEIPAILYGFTDIFLIGSYNSITNNTFLSETVNYPNNVIEVSSHSSHNLISGNIINGYDCNYIVGISISNNCNNNIISYNKISGCNFGIFISSSGENDVFYNTLSNLYWLGIDIYDHSRDNNICYNNFLNNKENAEFSMWSFKNIWDGNYWDEPRDSPCPIFGYIGWHPFWEIFWLFMFDSRAPPTLVKFDWHPASEPYDIGV